MYPAGVPRHTYSTREQVIRAPRLAGDRNPRHANTETPKQEYKLLNFMTILMKNYIIKKQNMETSVESL